MQFNKLKRFYSITPLYVCIGKLGKNYFTTEVFNWPKFVFVKKSPHFCKWVLKTTCCEQPMALKCKLIDIMVSTMRIFFFIYCLVRARNVIKMHLTVHRQDKRPFKTLFFLNRETNGQEKKTTSSDNIDKNIYALRNKCCCNVEKKNFLRHIAIDTICILEIDFRVGPR